MTSSNPRIVDLSSDPASPIPRTSDKKVPKSEKARVKKNGDFFDLVVKYNLGEQAFADTFDGAAELWRKVRSVVGKVAVGLDGRVTVRWAKVPHTGQLHMVNLLQKGAPWLKAFENSWGAEWLLGKAINQRVTDGKRGAKKRRHEEMVSQLAQTKAALPAPTSSSPASPSSSPAAAPAPAPPAPTPPAPTAHASSPLPNTPSSSITPAQQIQLLQEQLSLLIQQQQKSNHQATAEEPATHVEGMTAEVATPAPGNDDLANIDPRPVNSGRMATRRKGVSRTYQEAIRIERESEDEREQRRVKKVQKRQQKQKVGGEVDSLLEELGMNEKEQGTA
jgi:hypothetical protein